MQPCLELQLRGEGLTCSWFIFPGIGVSDGGCHSALSFRVLEL